MLSHDEATKRLDTFKIPSWRKQSTARVDKLPAADAKAVRVLALSGNKSWKSGHQERVADSARHLDNLSTKSRIASFAAVFPKLALDMEHCWQRMKLEPYTSGLYYAAQTPFRAPNDESMTHYRRGLWLKNLTQELQTLDQDAVWLAQWAPYFRRYYVSECIGRLLAAAIDRGGSAGDEVMQVLIDSANGDHEIGAMGRHIPHALLSCSRVEAWDYMEKLLLAAQRQEGLRQSILEYVDCAHPEAYKRMLKLILDENLMRFASVVRAADIWFALNWDSASAGTIKKSIERALKYLDSTEAQAEAIAGSDAEEAYFAIWAQGFADADVAVKSAIALLAHKKVEMRFTGAWLISLLQHPAGHAAMIDLLGDEDLRLARLAMASAACVAASSDKTPPKIFGLLEALLERTPKKPQILKPLLFPWLEYKIKQSDVANILPQFTPDPGDIRLLHYVPLMSVDGRSAYVRTLKNTKKLSSGARELLFQLTGDASAYVREEAIRILARIGIKACEAAPLEALMTRKAGDLRRGVLKLLRKQKSKDALASVDRLMASKNKSQRAAGVELIAALVKDKAIASACQARAQQFVKDHDDLTEGEQGLLDPLLGIVRDKATLDDALGLMDPAKCTQARPMKDHKSKLMTKSAVNLLLALEKHIHAHRETPVKVWTYDGEKEVLLGNADSIGGLTSYSAPEKVKTGDDFPLASLWKDWQSKLPRSCQDKDGLVLSRAALCFTCFDWDGKLNLNSARALKEATGVDISKVKLNYRKTVIDIICWLQVIQKKNVSIDSLLDAAETGFAQLAKTKSIVRLVRSHDSINKVYFAQATGVHDETWTDDQTRRLIEMMIWVDRPVDKKGNLLISKAEVARVNKGEDNWFHFTYRSRLAPKWMAHALRLNLYNEHDLYDSLIGPGGSSRGHTFFDSLKLFTTRKPSEYLEVAPQIRACVDKARERIIEVELARGDEPTAASGPAGSIRYIPGADKLARFVKALGKEAFARNYAYGQGGLNRKNIFSTLIRVTMPAPDDTAETFHAAMKDAGISQTRMIELGMFAPQWAKLIEQALNWDGYEDAVWWTHAHTKDDQWQVEQDVREQWAAAVAERTRLEGQDLVDGAVDVDWFHRTYQQLKKKRWTAINAAAKNASSSGGHKRAELFANAMLGNLTKTELNKRIKDKRHKDAVRALGLLPLQRGKSREKDLLSRYEEMQSFIRTSKKFGQMRQTSEKRASEIGQANLARSAGYADPLRLQWAMEAKAIEDLKGGCICETTGETEVTLTITDTGEPVISVIKAGKALKSIPAKAKKEKKIKALAARKTALKRQASRMRKSLEQMMCRHESFEAAELALLSEHPLMRPMLERLIFIGEGIAGFPDKNGRVLVDHAGKVEPIKKNEKLRIAHPCDLYERGDWSNWQQHLFAAERVQPFKQAFRELYILTDTEHEERQCTKRYAGHQVNPSQALALLGSRGWVTLPEEGVRKTFHEANLSAWLEFQESFYTPAEIDGLTLENVRFCRPGEWKSVPWEDVPPHIFSEAMRDMDLVVSVAHRGGIDPEASASTIQMRSDLLREPLAMLSIENVRIENNHVLIAGQHAKYSIHLGSAVTHLMPGGALFIVAVHSQHRGRLFLPFVDDDPKTAEVMSKTLMLARDQEIKDPNILDQIRAR